MNQHQSDKTWFSKTLLDWHKDIHRPMPWKGEKNPYLVWLSEVILQQTRVEQGLPYFEKFKSKYPAVSDLANATGDEVMKMWEGLGYYSRARNMHAAAKYIADELDGIFPKKYDEIKKLKGVGPYTAAAIASFAFDLPYAVVDGNVFRILSRCFGIHLPIDTTEGKKHFADTAQALLDKKYPGKYNQAIMDFGAIQCTPRPDCSSCPFNTDCIAFQNNTVGNLPLKLKKLKRKQRYFNYLVIEDETSVAIQQRTLKDIWKNLYEFPLIETESLVEDFGVLLNQSRLKGMDFQFKGVSSPLKQDLTHQQIIARFWKIEIVNKIRSGGNDWIWVSREKINDYAFPKVVAAYLRQKFLTLELF